MAPELLYLYASFSQRAYFAPLISHLVFRFKFVLYLFKRCCIFLLSEAHDGWEQDIEVWPFERLSLGVQHDAPSSDHRFDLKGTETRDDFHSASRLSSTAPGAWPSIEHALGIRQLLLDEMADHLEVVLVPLLVMHGMPLVAFAVSAGFDHED